MKRDDLIDQQCSVARSSTILGDRWTLVILSDCFLGVRRFDDFQERLGISRTTLTNRLQLLEEHGVLETRPYQDRPVRHEYRLTTKGRDLFPVINALVTWGDRYYADKAGPPILRRHKACGHDFESVMSCSECGEPIEARHIETRKRPDNKRYAPVVRGPMNRRGSKVADQA
jgi:DNA-binding HxlR family transcriptional regulator